MLKTLLKKCLHAAGYEVYRPGFEPVSPAVPTDMDLYRALYPVDSLEHRRFYNIGAGGFSHPAWTNVDHASEWIVYKENRCDMDWDLLALTKLPVEASKAEIVYSSHTIEHIPDPAAAHLFREAYRILKPGGTLRATAPNIDLYYRAYRDNDRRFFSWIEEPSYTVPDLYRKLGLCMPLKDATIGQLFLYEFASSASTVHGVRTAKIGDDELGCLFEQRSYVDALNACTARCPLDVQRQYPGNHINWWNEEKALRMLRDAGFSRVQRSGFGQSFVPVLRNTRYFDNTFPGISLYIEAMKT